MHPFYKYLGIGILRTHQRVECLNGGLAHENLNFNLSLATQAQI